MAANVIVVVVGCERFIGTPRFHLKKLGTRFASEAARQPPRLHRYCIAKKLVHGQTLSQEGASRASDIARLADSMGGPAGEVKPHPTSVCTAGGAGTMIASQVFGRQRAVEFGIDTGV
jgi:hypothetical protein